MKTYTKEQMILSDGEVVIYDQVNGWAEIIATTSIKTAQVEACVAFLDRKHFVRGVDVALLSVKYAQESLGKQMYGESSLRRNCIADFQEGYNANQAVLTLDQARKIWAAGVEASGTFQDALKIVQPLELPASITVDDEFNVINVKWE